MSLASRAISKITRICTEQIGGSFLGGLVASGIKGNYILMYHGVTATGNTRFNRRHASVNCFRKQIGFLKKYCNVISLDDFFEGKFDPRKANFALSFDDGYVNNFTNAKPILEEFKCPATFFITALNQIGDNMLWADYVNIATALTAEDIEVEGELFKKQGNTYFSQISGNSLYEVIKHQKADYPYKQKVRAAFSVHVNFENEPAIKEYWQLMTDEQIIETSRSAYIKIGSHGYYHNNLGTIAPVNAVDELTRSKKYLEGLVQYEVRQLAYPDGSYTPQLLSSAKQMGFNVQLAADHYHFNEQTDNKDIKKRYGIYTIDTCLNQLFTAIKTPD
jgi:peptidoglycan/xylan/chitin deacetylase (PgdA/CDA1 family)